MNPIAPDNYTDAGLVAEYPRFWFVAAELDRKAGDPPKVTSLVTGTGHPITWQAYDLDTIQSLARPFYLPGDLVVGFGLTALLESFIAMGWPLPAAVIDLRVEWYWRINGMGDADCLPVELRSVQSPVLIHEVVAGQVPDASTGRACLQAAAALPPLYDRLRRDGESIAGPRYLDYAINRGSFIGVAAQMQLRGIPVNTVLLARLEKQWPALMNQLRAEIDRGRGVYEGVVFKQQQWLALCHSLGVAWPMTKDGHPCLSDKSFARYAVDPVLAPYGVLRRLISRTLSIDLSVGADGRHRSDLHPYRSKTGRCQPSSNRSLFGCWGAMRGLLAPAPGMSLVEFDYAQEEVGIAAALSRDPAMMQDYAAGDAYQALADVTGASRANCKVVILAAFYGQGAAALSVSLGVTEYEARRLQDQLRQRYARFIQWQGKGVVSARANGFIRTVLDWRMRVTSETKTTTLMNFPMQANGSEILRLACQLVTGKGVRLLWSMQDALLIEASTDAAEEQTAVTRQAMVEAGRQLLGGFPLRVSVTPITSGLDLPKAQSLDARFLYQALTTMMEPEPGVGQ